MPLQETRCLSFLNSAAGSKISLLCCSKLAQQTKENPRMKELKHEQTVKKIWKGIRDQQDENFTPIGKICTEYHMGKSTFCSTYFLIVRVY